MKTFSFFICFQTGTKAICFSKSFFAKKLLCNKSYRNVLINDNITFTNYEIFELNRSGWSPLNAEMDLNVFGTYHLLVNNIEIILYCYCMLMENHLLIQLRNILVFHIYSCFQCENSVDSPSFS